MLSLFFLLAIAKVIIPVDIARISIPQDDISDSSKKGTS